MPKQVNGTNPQETIKLTPEQMKLVFEAQEAKRNGEPTHTEEEVMERCRAKVKTWLPGQSA